MAMRVPPQSNPDLRGVPDFASLEPDRVIAAVEKALGSRCSNLCRPLNSYINRVYEVGLEDGGFVIAKFYRPGRWSDAALQDELDFLTELHAAEVPVVPPLPGVDGAMLQRDSDLRFIVLPKRGGRQLDEISGDEWNHLGRLIARMHAVGSDHTPRDRLRLDPGLVTRQHLRYILESGTIEPRVAVRYRELVEQLIDDIAARFQGVDMFRIHGDCHRGNILHRPGEGYHLLDFDDMCVGPAVHDLWLLLPDRLNHAREEIERLLEGYETFLAFPWETLRLIEPLRAMRFIHYTAWCARQKTDGGFARLAPGWGTTAFWRQELADLERQREEIATS